MIDTLARLQLLRPAVCKFARSAFLRDGEVIRYLTGAIEVRRFQERVIGDEETKSGGIAPEEDTGRCGQSGSGFFSHTNALRTLRYA